MGKTSVKTRNSGQWTESRYVSFITSILRQGSRRWPPKFEVLKEAFAGVQLNKKSKRMGKHYLCASCQKEFPSAQVQVDHITPIGSTDSWDGFIAALFCEKDNLQVLCIPCHAEKTQQEKERAIENRKNN